MRRVAVLALVCAGCYSPVTELVTPHVEPGGTLTAMLDAEPAVTTVAIADATAQPMTLEGTSPTLVFGLIFGVDDFTGMPAHDQLVAGHEVHMTVTSTGTVQLSVHASGRSCAANTAAIHLVPDGNGHLNGDFTGLGDACQMSGTFMGIPINQ
jgi:hypothetical protein